jgi:AcrR family transcriptional regulator
MARPGPQTEKLRAERRQRILAAATALFAQNGFSATGISTIALAAGVSHGTVFLYFGSKEELFRAALVEPLNDAQSIFLQMGVATDSPLHRIQSMVRAQVTAISGQGDYLRLVHYVLGVRKRFPDLAEFLFDTGRLVTERMVPIIAEGQRIGEFAPGDPRGIAWAYFSYLQGIGLNIFDDSGTWVWEEMIQNGLRIFGPLIPETEEN